MSDSGRTSEVRQVRVERVLPATAERVFAAWTDPIMMARWLSPTGHAEIEADVRIGGKLRVTMLGDGMRIEHSGEYLALNPPYRLSFTWRSPYTGTNPSIVTVTLIPEGHSVRLVLVHDQLPDAHADAHQAGWGAILDNLSACVTAPERPGPKNKEEAMAIRKTARFTVHANKLPEALEAIRAFVAHTRTETGTLLYQSWQSSQRPTEFLHLMEFEDADAEQLHASGEAVRRFTEALYPLCAQAPAFDDWNQVT